MSSKSKAASHEWADPDADGGDGNPLLQPEGRRFPRSAKCNDWPWIVVWAAQMLVLLGVGLSYYARYRDEMGSTSAAASSRRTPTLDGRAFSLLVLLLGAATSLSLGYLLLIRAYTRQLIWASLWAAAGLLLGMLLYFAATNNVTGAICCGIGLPLHLIYMYLIRDAIPFATVILTTCVRILKLWPSTLLLALGGLLAQALWFVLWLTCALAIFYAADVEFDGGRPGSTDSANPNKRVVDVKLGFILFALLLSYFFTQQLLKNVVHASVSGVMASWYFLCGAEDAPRLPDHPVKASLRRACTTSLGSVALGSLLTAVVKAVRATFQLLARWLMADEPNCITCAVVCIIECILNVIEAVVEYINMYALSYVAIYGRPFFESAKLAFGLMANRGLDAVVNDGIIGNVLTVGALAVGAVCAILGGALAGSVAGSSADWRVWAVLGFLAGFGLALTVLSVVESAVVTLFVCLADDPAALRRTKPQVYQDIVPTLQQMDGVELEEAGEGQRRGAARV